MTCRMLIFNVLDSTHLYAKELITQDYDSEDCLGILAHTQTHGVGRFNRIWQDVSRENLKFNLLLKQGYLWSSLKDLPIVSLLCALAIQKTLTYYLDKNNSIHIKCKWPNDVLVESSKISGILLAVHENKKGKLYLSIGIGVNIAESPKIFEYKTTALADYISLYPKSVDFLELMLDHLWYYFSLLNLDKRYILDQWLQAAYMLGQHVTINVTKDKQLSGIFSDIDENGGLILDNGLTAYTGDMLIW